MIMVISTRNPLLSLSLGSLLSFSLLASLHGAKAANIGQECGSKLGDVTDALEEAIDIATYAQTRWQGLPNLRGTLLGDMIGAPAENDQASLEAAAGWFGKAAAAGNDGNLMVHCSGDFLNKPLPGTGAWGDGKGTRVQTGQTDNACGNLRGFYFTSSDSSGARIRNVVLCSGTNGAMNTYRQAVVLYGFNLHGDLTKGLLAQWGINFIGTYLSYMILHELMHAADDLYFPAKLPSGRSEAYGYDTIAGHAVGVSGNNGGISVADKQHNADSYAILGCAWWLYRYLWQDGSALVAKKSERPPNAPPTTGFYNEN